MKINELPYYIGVFDKPLKNFPKRAPFELEFNEDLGLYQQKNNDYITTLNKQAYDLGSSLSSPLGSSSLSNRWLASIVQALKDNVLFSRRERYQVLEIGCGDGELLAHLSTLWPNSTFTGVDPDPSILNGIAATRENINLVNDLWRPNDTTYDLIITHGVIEHIANPVSFLIQIREALNVNGVSFNCVPNCKLAIDKGDPSILVHEHYSFFTPSSFRHVLHKSGLSEYTNVDPTYGWMIYSFSKPMVKNIPIQKDSINQFSEYCEKVEGIDARLSAFLGKNRSIIYGTSPYVLKHGDFVFTDSDSFKHGKYLSAFETAIVENSLENISQYDACVISVRNFEKEISEHLISLGLEANKIIPISKFDSE